MSQYTLIAGDVQYLSYYLKEKDPTSGSITYFNLTTQDSIWFRMRKYGESTNTLSLAMGTVSSPHATLGYCRVLVTVPVAGTYSSEIEVYETTERLTWPGNIYVIKEALG